jgi:hypothetical protein
MLKFFKGINSLSGDMKGLLVMLDVMMVVFGFVAAIPLTYIVVESFLPTCEEAAQEKVEPIHPTKKES